MNGRKTRWKQLGIGGVALLALALLAAGGVGASGPGDYLKFVPGVHEAFIYVDVAQIRNSKLYANLKGDLMVGPVQAGVAAFEQFTGIRVPDDLDVVAGSSKIAKDGQGILFIHGRMDRQRIESLFAMNPGYSETIKPGGKMIGFLDENKGTMSYLSFLRNDLIVIGQKEGVEGALGVVAGDGGSLAESPSVKTQLAHAGSSPVVMVIAQKPAQLPPDANKIPAIQNVKSLLLTLTPGPETLTLIAQVETDTQELATQLLDIVRGLVALGQIQQQAPQVAEFARMVSAERKDATVLVKADINTVRAEEVIRRQIQQRGAQRPNVGGERIQGAPEEKPIPPQW